MSSWIQWMPADDAGDGLRGGGRPAIADLTYYSYDNASDILSRVDSRPGASRPDRDERYTYDGLNRLVSADRGVWTGNPGEPGAAFTPGGTKSQSWALDHLGNQTEVVTDTQGTAGTLEPGTDMTLTRAYNLVNETVAKETASGGGGPTALPVRSDASGNRLEDGAKAFVYDAWNRLVGVDVGGTPRARYTYYPMHQRATRMADEDLTTTGVFEEHGEFFCDAAWRLLEGHTHRGDAYDALPPGRAGGEGEDGGLHRRRGRPARAPGGRTPLTAACPVQAEPAGIR